MVARSYNGLRDRRLSHEVVSSVVVAVTVGGDMSIAVVDQRAAVRLAVTVATTSTQVDRI